MVCNVCIQQYFVVHLHTATHQMHRCCVKHSRYRFDETALVLELLDGMYIELPEKKPTKAR